MQFFDMNQNSRRAAQASLLPGDDNEIQVEILRQFSTLLKGSVFAFWIVRKKTSTPIGDVEVF